MLNQEGTDKDILISMLIHAIVELEERLRRNPTKNEVLDYLFSKERDDFEALALSKKLSRILATLLDDWAAMDDFSEEDDQYVFQPNR
jgi:hypothetical protein